MINDKNRFFVLRYGKLPEKLDLNSYISSDHLVLFKNPHFNENHAKQIYDDKARTGSLSNLASYAKLDDDTFNNLLDRNHYIELSENPKLKHSQIDRLLDTHGHMFSVAYSLATNPSIGNQHIDKLIDHHDPDIVDKIAKNPRLDSGHIDRLIDKPEDIYIEGSIARRKDLRPHHIDALLNKSNHSFIRSILFRNPRYKAYIEGKK